MDPEQELSYTAKYEYLCSIVAMFLDREEELDKKDEDHVYRDGLIKTLFMADYSKVIYPKVEEALRRNLSFVPGSEPHTAALTRLNSVFIGAYAALGEEFMKKFIDNTIAGLCNVLGTTGPKPNWLQRLLGDAREKDAETITAFVREFPIVTVCIAGSLEYAKRLLRRRRGSQSSYIAQTTTGSPPRGASRA